MRVEHGLARHAALLPMPAPHALFLERIFGDGRRLAQQAAHFVLCHARSYLGNVLRRQHLRDRDELAVCIDIDEIGIRARRSTRIFQTLRAVGIGSRRFRLAHLIANLRLGRHAGVRSLSSNVSGLTALKNALSLFMASAFCWSLQPASSTADTHVAVSRSLFIPA